MKHSFAFSPTKAVIVIALLATLPAAALIISNGLSRYTQAEDLAALHGLHYVHTLAERQRHATEDARELLAVQTHSQELQTLDRKDGARLLQKMLQQHPAYHDFFLATPSGDILASASGNLATARMERTGFMRDMTRADAFTVGIAPSSQTGEATLYCAQPFALGNGGKAILGSVAPIRYGEHKLLGPSSPSDGNFFVVAGAGLSIAKYPPTILYSKQSILRILRQFADHKEPRGALRVTDPRGNKLLASFHKLALQNAAAPDLYIFNFQPEEAVYRHAQELLRRDLLLLALAVALAGLTAWGMSHFAFVAPIREILSLATRLESGEWGARVPAVGGKGELQLLAQEFNMMAQTLQTREQELVAAREAAEYSSKVKSDFLANMSHEIRTPMNAILGMTYLVSKMDLSRQQRDYMTKLTMAANRLLRIINDILDFSKMEAGRLSLERISFSLPRLLGSVRNEAAGKIEDKDVSLGMLLEPDVPEQLLGDPLRLTQALATLMAEAISRSDRGEVRLTCALAEKTESDVLLRFSVADAGVGMTPVQLASQKALFSGETIPAAMNLDSGNLALVVCARLFHMMGGATEITSDFGYGATYSTSIRFGVACATLDHRSAIFATQRALVVEANDAVRSSLVDMLVGFSMRASGLERQERIVSALRSAEQQQDPFTLLVVDWRPTTSAMHSLMVGIHDAALAFPPMVIATLSTHIHEETLSLDKYGLSAVIYKPVNVSLLFDALVNLLIGKKSARLPAKDPAADPPPDRLDGMRILLVEDNRINQQIAGELLGGAGAAISFANNGLEALRVLQERGVTAFDLALMDLQMPEMNGLDATKAIRALGPFTRMSLPVIAMTANADAQEVTECLRAGMNGHTVKPITVSRLFDVVKNWAPLAPSHSPLVLAMVEKLRLRLPELPLPPDLAEKTLLPLLPLAHTGRAQLLMDAMTQNDPEPLRSLLDDLEELARLRAPAAPADAPTTENIEGGRQ